MLVFEMDIGQAMITACEYTDGMYLAKAAEIVKKEISQHKIRFNGSFDDVSMSETVPNSLLELVSMIEHGPGIEFQIENGITDSDLAISQLLLFNYHKKADKDTSNR